MSLILLSFSNNLLAQENAAKDVGKPIQYNFGHRYKIQSKILEEERKLLIYVPEKYQQSTDKLPVVYILQGNIHYKHATISVEKLQKSGWIPASIIVAIPDNKGKNTRDYSKESDNFLRFINEEVQPFVAKNFRVNGFKTLFGHRASGKFVLDTFLKDPDEFDIYISANASFRKKTITRFERFLDKNKNKIFSQALYFSMGTIVDNGPYNVEPAEELADLLKNKAPKSLQWKYQYLPLHGAHSSANVTLYDGLAETFSDYLGTSYSYQEFIDINGMEGIKASFRARAKKYHISDKVDIGTFMGLGFSFMDNGHPKEAVELITDGIKNYFPESIQLHRVLGRAYEKMESYEQALKTYEKMVLLAKQQNSPRLDFFESQVEWVKKKM
jgi:predicted alpha/beta superfamily hydrolase